MKSPKRLFLGLGLILLLGGALLGFLIQTGGGSIRVKDVRFTGSGGNTLSAYLYIPPGASAETPAPGILAIHGYINSRETQSGFAIELARRGFVVLALDQTGHGYSDPPAFAGGFGGPDGLEYLRSLEFVDKDNIGMEGHSMGGWASVTAAAMNPDGYKSLVLEGSSTGSGFAPEGSPEFPRNLAVVFSRFDEFSYLMWEVPTGSGVVESEKLKRLFGTENSVEPRRLYGSLEGGTGRKLFTPSTTHPGDHLSREAIGHAVSWFQETLEGGSDLDPEDQIWYWKEAGTLLSFIGLIILIMVFGSALLTCPFFGDLVSEQREPAPLKGSGWWLGAVITLAVPALTFFPFMKAGAGLLKASALFPQTISSQIAVWALLNGAVSMVLLLLWHFLSQKKRGITAAAYGLTWPEGFRWKYLGKALLFAITLTVITQLMAVVTGKLFLTDFRFWVLALKPAAPLHYAIALRYILFFALAYTAVSAVLYGQLRLSPDRGLGVRLLVNALLMGGGMALFLILQYAPLLSGGTLLTPTEPLNVIIAIQFVPILMIVGLFTTFFAEKTGKVFPGALTAAFFVTLYIVAGQATQFPL